MIPRSGPARRREILRRCAHLPSDLLQDPTYAIDSPLWALWFEAEHDAWCDMVEAHLKGLEDNDFDYEEAEAAFKHPQPPPPPQ
jgi:hypothetical protein